MLRELEHALRGLLRTPAVSCTIVLTLGLCIAATAAVGNLINGFFQRLPVPDAERVLALYTGSDSWGPYGRTSYPDYRDYLERNEVFGGLGASGNVSFSMDTGGRTDWIWGAVVTGEFFDTLGLRPAVGRFFAPEEGRPGGPHVAVISHRLWRERFDQDAAVVGKRVRLNQNEFTIIGVAPRSFVGLRAFYHPQMWVPVHHTPLLAHNQGPWLEDRSTTWLDVIGRLRPEVSRTQAQAQMDQLAQQVEAQHPREGNERRVTVEVATHMDPTSREWYLPTSRILLAAAVLLLLIGCFNVANLMMARAVARRRELATRLAVGAGRWSLVRLTLFEALWLSLAAGSMVWWSTSWTGATIARYFAPPVQGAPGDAPIFQPDARVMVFVLVLVAAVTCLIGVVPAFRASRTNLVSGLRDDGALFQGSRRWGLADGLVILQVALSLALLTCAGLISRSMDFILEDPPGYEVQGLAIAALRVPLEDYDPAIEALDRFYLPLLDEARSMAGVRQVSITEVAPLSGYARSDVITIPGVTTEPVGIDRSLVGPEFFETVGIELLAGELFTAAHDIDADRVAVVNSQLARAFWPDLQDAVGKQMLIGELAYTILGVVEDTKYLSLQEEPRNLAYFSLHQRFTPFLSLIARVDGEATSLAAPLRKAVRDLHVNAAVLYVSSLKQWSEGSIWEPRLRTDVLRVFGLLGLLLTAVGVFSLMRYNVLQRLRELGIRLALGASRRQISLLVLRRGLILGALGLVFGLPLAYYASGLLAGFLFGVETFDLRVTLALSGLLLAVILVAAFLPARRASRLDPLQVIRHD